ncbi:hypothetical protein [Nautilia sp.]
MKKLILLSLTGSIIFAENILPAQFGNCTQISFFNKYNAPIAINDYMQIIKKYSCGSNILYIGIEDRIPGILKLSTDKNTNDFLLKYFALQNYPAAVYVDKRFQKGVIAVQLDNNKALKVLFYGTDYKQALSDIKKLNIKKTAKKL